MNSNGPANQSGKLRHKASYHRYFQGYTEVRVNKPGGGYRIERYYTAPWKRQNTETCGWILRKLLYCMLALVSIGSMIFTMRADVISNYVWYVVLPAVVAVLCAFLLCVSAVSYLAQPRNMTIGDYTSSVRRIRGTALATAISGTVVLFIKLGYAALCGAAGLSGEFENAALLLPTICAAVCVYAVEKRTTYVDVPNDTQPPQNGVKIG